LLKHWKKRWGKKLGKVFSVTARWAIDLGTIIPLVYVSRQRIVLQEPSICYAIKACRYATGGWKRSQADDQAYPSNVVAMRPLRDSVIWPILKAEQMLKHFIRRVHGRRTLISPRVVIRDSSGCR